MKVVGWILIVVGFVFVCVSGCLFLLIVACGICNAM